MAHFKVDQSKLDRQNLFLDIWENNGRVGTLEAATGFGKTYVGVLAIQRLLKLKSDLTVAVVVPSTYLYNNWTKLVNFYGFDNVRVDTINMWVKETSVDVDLLIMDEIHNYTGGEVFSTIFSLMNYRCLLGLTAKQRNKEEDKQVIEKNAPILHRVPITECLEKKWVAPFDIFNLGLELPMGDRLKYNKMDTKFKRYFSTFHFKLNLMFACLNSKTFREQYAARYNWEPGMVVAHAAQANRIMQKRKEFLYTHPVILDAALEVLELFKGKQTITFSEITDFADILGEHTEDRSVVYHSSQPTQIRDSTGKIIARGKRIDGKTKYVDNKGNAYTWKGIKKAYPTLHLTRYGKDRLNKQALEDFNNGKAEIIHTSKALNEGVDIHGIERSLKTSYTSTDLDALQRTGRAVRLDENNPDKRALEVNLYIKNTQSELWLRKAQKGFPNIHWVDSIEDIIIAET